MCQTAIRQFGQGFCYEHKIPENAYLQIPVLECRQYRIVFVPARPNLILENWCILLESGFYKQTREFLCDEDGYCCLGVYASNKLGMRYAKDMISYIEENEDPNPKSIEEHELTTREIISMGLPYCYFIRTDRLDDIYERDKSYYGIQSNYFMKELINANDREEQLSFKEIAYCIRQRCGLTPQSKSI